MYFLLWLYFWIFVPWHTHWRVYAKLFIFLFSIQNKQVHNLNTESSIIANIFTQTSCFFFLGYGKTETWDSVRAETLDTTWKTWDPGPIFSPKFSSDNFENVNSSVFKPLLHKNYNIIILVVVVNRSDSFLTRTKYL